MPKHHLICSPLDVAVLSHAQLSIIHKVQYRVLRVILLSNLRFSPFFSQTMPREDQSICCKSSVQYSIVCGMYVCVVFFRSKWFWNCLKMSSNAVVVVVFVIVAYFLVDIQRRALHVHWFVHTLTHCHWWHHRHAHKLSLAHSTVRCNRVFLNGTNGTGVRLTLFRLNCDGSNCNRYNYWFGNR